MGTVGLRRLSAPIVALCLLFWLCAYAAGASSGRLYYDSQGNVISAEDYRKLTGQQSWVETPPQADQPADGTLQPATESAPEAPAAADQPDLPAGAVQSGEVAPAAEKKIDKPVPARDEAQAVAAAAEPVPAFEESLESPLYEMGVASDTLFRAFQRDTESQADALVTPLYEYLQIDLDAPESGLSLHTYGWARQDLNDSGFYHDNPDGEFLYGYVEYSRPDYGLNLKLGRQHVFDGVLNSSLDGLGIKSALTPYFDLSLYGGVPVALSSENGRSGDSILGGRISAHLGARYELGVSYKLENSDGEKDGEMLGVDFSLTLPGNAYLRGLSAYNPDTKGWGKHYYEAGFDLGDFQFRPVYERYQYVDYFNQKDNSADPFRFLAGTGEILTALGGDILWHQFRQVELGAKVMHYRYDLRNDDAMYYEGNLAWYLKGLTQVGGQFGRMDGGTAETAYYLTRGFFYWNRPPLGLPLKFVSGDVVYVLYDAEIFGKDTSLFLSLGTGVSFLDDSLEVKLSGDYSSDPYFDSDFRGMLTVTYRKTVQSRFGRDPQRGGRE